VGEQKNIPGLIQRLIPMAEKQVEGLGLLQKLTLGIFVPIFLAFLVIGGMLFVSIHLGKVQFLSIRELGFDSLKQLGAASVKESTAALNRLGEKIIQEKAEGVAKQIEIYLESHPGMSGISLADNPRLQEIAVQRVGETGYTAVHDNRGINYFHVNPKIVRTDLHKLGAKLPDFVKILDEGLRRPASGYYDWSDVDGKVRAKYMYTTPVQGTNLVVAATTYIDEFSQPAKKIVGTVNQMEASYAAHYNWRFLLFLLIVVVDLAILLAVIYLFSFSVVRPIRNLSEAADRISMGDLDATIDVKGKGEVAALAKSVDRMRTSVKTAIELLQRKRESHSVTGPK
jgi:HAMP domain-containing protein